MFLVCVRFVVLKNDRYWGKLIKGCVGERSVKVVGVVFVCVSCIRTCDVDVMLSDKSCKFVRGFIKSVYV